VGYLRDETGVGESARATMRALHHRDFPLAWTMVKSHTARKNDQSVLHLPQGHPYDINLLYVNADQMVTVYNELGPEFFADKYNIGYWAWELERFPEEWHDRFRYLDEVWVGSRFVQNTLAHVSPIPIVIMGVGMDRQPTFNREPLEQAVASVSGILIDGYLDRSELDGLFNACDVYVSLHRSEGFGMTIAEAMSLGKPVIATDYAGNTDYMNVSNSYPVEYRLIELEQDYGPYKKGQVWADPDLNHAAAQMRRVFENYDEALRKGKRAADDIKHRYGSEAMARKIIERLNTVLSWSQ